MNATGLGDARPMRIAVADDDRDVRELIAEHLRREGLVVTELQDGRELMDALNNAPPAYFDLVICDQYMPHLRGTECLAFAGSRARFVIMTGGDDARVRSAARQFGAVAFLKKPIELDELVTLVHELGRTEPTTGVRPRIPDSDPPG